MNTSKILGYTIVVLLFVGMIYLKLKGTHDAYGKDYNEQRKELGILEIPEDWFTKGKGTTTKLWMPRNIDEISKGRLGKEVLVDKKTDEIYLERDRIINKTAGVDKFVEVSYQFNSEPKFIYKYFEYENNEPRSNESVLSKEEFDEIAREWGLSL